MHSRMSQDQNLVNLMSFILFCSVLFLLTVHYIIILSSVKPLSHFHNLIHAVHMDQVG